MSATKYLDSTGLAYFWSKIKSALGLKADDSGVVHIAGTETITGTKTLSSVNTITYSDTAAGNTKNILYGKIASNDYFRVLVGGTSNASYLAIDTADDGNEPIHVRQYKGAFTTLRRTATLLDGYGNTAFPGTVTASGFIGNVTGDCSGSSGSCTGNAATATTLKTARKINGVSFDGSADVTLTAVVSSASRSADIAADGTFTVPSYTVGRGQLLVYLDGCLSRQGDGWDEVGTSGTASTAIKFNQLIPMDMEIVVRVN